MSSAKNGEQIRLERRTSFYWRVTFDHPPLNIFGPETIPQLNEIVTALETDSEVKVVVLDSAVDGFFFDTLQFSRQARRHNTFVARRYWIVPGSRHAGAPEPRSSRLDCLNPRARPALEASLRSHAICVLPVSNGPSCRNLKLALALCQVAARWPDYLASLAEDGPWKCCSAPMTFLAILLSVMATSIVLYRTRNSMLLSRRWPCGLLRSTNRPSLRRRISSILQAYPDAEIAPEWDACIASLQRPAAQSRINALLQRGLHKPGDVENRLGYYVGQLGS
jgi:hypothetical protein